MRLRRPSPTHQFKPRNAHCFKCSARIRTAADIAGLTMDKQHALCPECAKGCTFVRGTGKYTGR
jgi:hypothetical protein